MFLKFSFITFQACNKHRFGAKLFLSAHLMSLSFRLLESEKGIVHPSYNTARGFKIKERAEEHLAWVNASTEKIKGGYYSQGPQGPRGLEGSLRGARMTRASTALRAGGSLVGIPGGRSDWAFSVSAGGGVWPVQPHAPFLPQLCNSFQTAQVTAWGEG